MTKREVMIRAHQLAQQYTGDYSARLSLALREVWREYHLSIRAEVINGELGILGVWLIEHGKATAKEVLTVSERKAASYLRKYARDYSGILLDYQELIAN